MLGQCARRGRRDGSVGGVASAAGAPPPEIRRRRAAWQTGDLRASRFARRRTARSGGVPRPAPSAGRSRCGASRTGGRVSVGHGHSHAHGHGHSHGLVARSIVSSRAGLRAVSLSLVVLLATAAVQGAIFVLTGSVALLADLIHNFGDALTAIPLGVAFLMRSFTAEKRAGYFVVA